MRVGLSGDLHFGVIPAAMPMAPLVTSAFCKSHPLVTLKVLSLSSIEIQRGLDAEELDAGLTYHAAGKEAAMAFELGLYTFGDLMPNVAALGGGDPSFALWVPCICLGAVLIGSVVALGRGAGGAKA